MKWRHNKKGFYVTLFVICLGLTPWKMFLVTIYVGLRQYFFFSFRTIWRGRSFFGFFCTNDLHYTRERTQSLYFSCDPFSFPVNMFRVCNILLSGSYYKVINTIRCYHYILQLLSIITQTSYVLGIQYWIVEKTCRF